MDNISKVIFPLIARFQDDREKIKKLCEKLIAYQASLLIPIYILAILLMPILVQIIPKYNKWESAIPLFNIFCISSIILSLAAPFINLFNALGKVKITMTFMLIFTAITWLLTPILTKNFGTLGFPLTHLVVSVSFLAVLIKAKREIGFSFKNITQINLIEEFKSLLKHD